MKYIDINNPSDTTLMSIKLPRNPLLTGDELQLLYKELYITNKSTPQEIYNDLSEPTTCLLYCGEVSIGSIKGLMDEHSFYHLVGDAELAEYLAKITNFVFESREEYTVNYKVWLNKSKFLIFCVSKTSHWVIFNKVQCVSGIVSI